MSYLRVGDHRSLKNFVASLVFQQSAPTLIEHGLDQAMARATGASGSVLLSVRRYLQPMFCYTIISNLKKGSWWSRLLRIRRIKQWLRNLLQRRLPSPDLGPSTGQIDSLQPSVNIVFLVEYVFDIFVDNLRSYMR